MSLQTNRRHRTARRIQMAAVKLAVRDGLANITTEAIAHEAGVSARTFFNYYPYKEAAIMGPPPDYPAEAVEAFAQGTGTVAADLDALITAHLSRFLQEREMLGHVLRLADTDLKLQALRGNLILARRSQMADLLRRRLPNESRPKIDILAASIIAATNTATNDWALGGQEDFIATARDYLAMILPAARLLERGTAEG